MCLGNCSEAALNLKLALSVGPDSAHQTAVDVAEVRVDMCDVSLLVCLLNRVLTSVK